jgi:dethiobiotin synthetase
VVAITGAATDAGKTWVAAAVLTRLRAAGLAVSARKPVQSYEVEAGATDADVLAGATGEDAGTVCPRHRWYPLAMAPPIAARRLGRDPIRLGDLVAELDWPAAV